MKILCRTSRPMSSTQGSSRVQEAEEGRRLLFNLPQEAGEGREAR